MPAGKDTVFARITVDIQGFIPGGGDLFHKIDLKPGNIGEVIRGQCKHLYRVLEKNACGQLEAIGGYAFLSFPVSFVEIFVQHNASELHTGYTVPYKGMKA